MTHAPIVCRSAGREPGHLRLCRFRSVEGQLLRRPEEAVDDAFGHEDAIRVLIGDQLQLSHLESAVCPSFSGNMLYEGYGLLIIRGAL